MPDTIVYTKPADVRHRWLDTDATIPPDETLEVVILDAEDTIRGAISDLDERVFDGRIPRERLVKIVARMVIRHVQNPRGIRQQQHTTGPFTGTLTYGGDEPGAVYLTSAERRELLGRMGKKAYMIDTMPAYARRRRW